MRTNATSDEDDVDLLKEDEDTSTFALFCMSILSNFDKCAAHHNISNAFSVHQVLPVNNPSAHTR